MIDMPVTCPLSLEQAETIIQRSVASDHALRMEGMLALIRSITAAGKVVTLPADRQHILWQMVDYAMAHQLWNECLLHIEGPQGVQLMSERTLDTLYPQ